MNKVVCFLFASFLISSAVVSAQSNPVLMKIGDEEITRSEFEYSFNKNKSPQDIIGNKDVGEYLKLFIDYKLKVKEAKKKGIDKLPSFINEFHMYRNAQLMPYLLDTAYVDSVAYAVYQKMKDRVGDADLLRVAHIFISLPQKASSFERRASESKIDSVYSLLKEKKADFADLASKISDDRSSATKGGELPWLSPNTSLREFEEIAYSLKEGETSKPFLSTAGFHIIKMLERKPFPSFASEKSSIVKYLEQTGIEEEAFKRNTDRLISNGTYKSIDELLDRTEAEVVKNNPDLKYLIREYYEGLLVISLRDEEVDDKEKCSDESLQAFFKKNRSLFKWDTPRFKGYTLSAHTKQTLKTAKKSLKKMAKKGDRMEQSKAASIDTAQVICSFWYVKKGDSQIVDNIVFDKKKKGDTPQSAFLDFYGVTMKKPETYQDVKQQVVSQYKNHLEKEWVDILREKYKHDIVVDAAILKTVNHHK